MPTFSKNVTTKKGHALVPTAYLATIGRTYATTVLRLLKNAHIKPERTVNTGERTYRFWGNLAVKTVTAWRDERDGITKGAPDTKETVVEVTTHAQPVSDEQRFKALADALAQAVSDFTVARNDLVTIRTEQTEIKRLLMNVLDELTKPRPQPQPVNWNRELRFAVGGGPNTTFNPPDFSRAWPLYDGRAAGQAFTNGQLDQAAGKVDG